MGADAARPPCVLVVEDDDAIRTVLCDALEIEGYRVALARDAPEAMGLLGGAALASPVALILDAWAPDGDEPELLDAYRRVAGPHAPIILMSASLAMLEPELRAAASTLLLMPFELDDLLDSLAAAGIVPSIPR